MKSEKNVHLRKALFDALKAENISASAWCAKNGLHPSQISRMGKFQVRPDVMRKFVSPNAWKSPKTSSSIMAAAIKDFIEDAGRSSAEFNIKGSDNKANVQIENNLRIIQEFAADSSDFVSLLNEMAEMIKARKKRR